MKRPSRRRIVFGVIVLVLVMPLCSLVILIAYEVNPKTALIRESIGQDVTVVCGSAGQPFSGKLVSARYRLNDTVGFFDLEIHVEHEKGALITGLSPWQLSRVEVGQGEKAK